MKANNNKILALINIEEPIETIVESTVNIAETLRGEVNFFYVKKKTDQTRTENQLSILRTRAQDEKAVMKLKNVLARVQKMTPVKLGYTVSSGNVKKAILSEINSGNPNLVVLGKRIPSMYRLVGNQITELVLKNFRGPVLIAHSSKVLEIKENLSLGVLNDLKAVSENNVTSLLMQESRQPLKLFKIEDALTFEKSIDSKLMESINFTFENNENALKSLTSYVHKNNVHLLCLEPMEKLKSRKTLKLNEVLKNINTSMLMLGNETTNNLIKA